ncbi:hypothetical protein PPYR_08685 [Photinus pyralis]|uniref:FAD dependent oxidoreductase domain-containing protein n=1 Tax=Photinus pyralis TaxID=7054 RepID=A0A5N4A3V9_PHOPY|nr:D-aspartate oxidase-like [Photinus pyralis]XP_031357388.1 D-aspartate oxidase-like [Photinus pyralis]XP_031357440.1 D-aspartate oxidase-like [Photinus pyralis]KAB0791982.1 hypothetical protein PPYR_13943 [Photinus pyralis]KAB0797692.1 hypothetical protein PPYR_08685 [Photinus pyralis]
MYNIAILGGGVIGLTTAAVLQDRLSSTANITVYADRLSPNTTGDVSAGLWTLFLIQDPDLDKILAWGRRTYEWVLQLWKAGHAGEAGIALQPVKLLLNDGTQSKNASVVFGECPMAKVQVEEVNKALQVEFQAGVNYVTFTCQMTKYLPFLQRRFVQEGGKIVVRRVDSLNQLGEYDAIVNCSGMDASSLVGDDQMSPIRGQVIKVEAPWQFSTVLAGGSYVIVNEESTVLGGTAQIGDYGQDVRSSDSEKILRNCTKLVPSLKNTKVIAHMAGLRPGRTRVRLETEIKEIAGRRLPVIHNYGHGGSGVTLSYGCALSTLQLVKEALKINLKSKM